MRLQSLRQTANRYLKMDRRGSFKDKQHRAFVIHKLMDDLFLMGNVPATWHQLTPIHIQKLVEHWQQLKINPATIMRYMTVIRRFLTRIDCSIDGIDNQSLCLTRSYKRPKRNNIQANIWQAITEPSARFIMALQTQFGLNIGEAIRFIPDIHFRDNGLWITREIAFNSEDRVIPLRNETQKLLIDEITAHTNSSKNLMQLYGYNDIRYQWRKALAAQHLPSNKSYRYLYAQQMKADLSPIHGNYRACLLIRDEMGIKSRNTLWLYLHE